MLNSQKTENTEGSVYKVIFTPRSNFKYPFPTSIQTKATNRISYCKTSVNMVVMPLSKDFIQSQMDPGLDTMILQAWFAKKTFVNTNDSQL